MQHIRSTWSSWAPESFYGFLARHGRELFRDEAFAELYCADFGRPSVPPSLLAITLLLQAHSIEQLCRVLAEVEAEEGDPARRVYFGPEEPLRAYFGEDEGMVIMAEGEWVEEFYGARPR